MARDSRLRIGGWLAGAGPRSDPSRRSGGDRGPDPSPAPDVVAADDARAVAAGDPCAGDGTWPPGGDAPLDRADAWPDDASSGPDDGVPWPSEHAGLVSEGADLGADLPETVPGRPDRAGAPARFYRGRRRRRRPFGQVAAVAAVVGLVLVGTGVIVQWAGTSGEGSLGPPPRPDPVPTAPTSPDGDRPVTPDVGVSSGPDRDGDAGRGEDRTPDGSETAAGPTGDAAGSTGDAAGPTGDAAGSTGGAFEAEDGSLARGASIEALAAASGGRVVRLSPNASVELSGITVDRSGTYRLTVHYATTASRSAQVSVNGAQSVAVEFPELDRGAVGAVVLLVALAAGENTVTVASPDMPGLMLDRITVTD